MRALQLIVEATGLDVGVAIVMVDGGETLLNLRKVNTYGVQMVAIDRIEGQRVADDEQSWDIANQFFLSPGEAMALINGLHAAMEP